MTHCWYEYAHGFIGKCSLAAVMSSFPVMKEQSSVRKPTKLEEQERNGCISSFFVNLTKCLNRFTRSPLVHKYTLVITRPHKRVGLCDRLCGGGELMDLIVSAPLTPESLQTPLLFWFSLQLGCKSNK